MQDSRAKRFEKRNRNKADTRIGCKAMMVGRKKKDEEKWIVSKVVEKHNHNVITPSKTQLFRSQRQIDRPEPIDYHGHHGFMVFGNEQIQVSHQESATSKYCKLCKMGVNIVCKASPYDEVDEVAMKGLRNTLQDVEVALWNISLRSGEQNEETEKE
ncbi:hypothetical protein IFM89_022920 [Coptis chinensis]|uniref:FAR1 domain-containing protein n=1 Tax=Coptis chinensis TaxID=261450 RepID=A0A835MF71_9MAGN|nr:hypothetical protein IFM89_022920 [Coptis chinensis]